MNRLILSLILLPGCAGETAPLATIAVPERTAAVEASVVTVASQPAATTQEKPPPAKNSPRTLDERLLFFPAKHPIGVWQPAAVTFEDVWFKAADSTKLHGWYCPCRNPRAVVLLFHGNGGNLTHRAWLLRALQSDLHTSVLIFDYRGYGRSEGVPTVEGVLQDGRAARKELAKLAKVEESAIVLMGESLGGAVAVQLAAEAPARGLILDSVFCSLKEVAAHHYPLLAGMVPPNKLDSATAIARFKGPVLQFHGDADRTIPIALGRKLQDSANVPKRFVTLPGLDHNDRRPPAYFQALDRFLGELPRP